MLRKRRVFLDMDQGRRRAVAVSQELRKGGALKRKRLPDLKEVRRESGAGLDGSANG
jgi:hypothetical protein